MCTVCGCGHGEAAIDGAPVHDHDHRHDHTPGHRDDHGAHGHGAHGHGAHGHGHSHGHGHQHSETGRVIALQQDILAKNAAFAMVNRRVLAEGGVLAINLMSSPGSGKTTLLEVTVKALARECPIAVIEGDQQTAHDAERIRTAGAPAIQINTGKGCHLDAHMVGHAIDHLGIQDGVLFIENVGNLVCPAAFDLGESKRVVILSVTEGEDKPLKYPDIFARADLLILTKSDLLPYVDFDPERCIDCARRINPNVSVFRLSARTGEGVALWLDWVRACLQDQATR